MNQLIEGMLAVGSRLAPVDRARVVSHALPLERHVLAVALHGELLEVGGEAFQILIVGQHRDGLRAEEVGVPDSQKSQDTPADSASKGAVRKCSSIS